MTARAAGRFAEHPLVGSWSLRRWVALRPDGAGDGEEETMGPQPEGLLVYAPDGTMVTVLARADRARFDDDDLTGGTDAERAAAFTGFVAYGGRWTADGSIVRHAVGISLFPNWVGTTQERAWQLDEDGLRLTLTSPPIGVGGRRRVQRLTWERLVP